MHYTDSQAFERLNCDDQRRETRNGSASSEVRILSAWCLLSKRSSCKTGCLHRELSSFPIFNFSVLNGATKIIKNKSVVEDDIALASWFLFCPLWSQNQFQILNLVIIRRVSLLFPDSVSENSNSSVVTPSEMTRAKCLIVSPGLKLFYFLLCVYACVRKSSICTFIDSLFVRIHRLAGNDKITLITGFLINWNIFRDEIYLECTWYLIKKETG